MTILKKIPIAALVFSIIPQLVFAFSCHDAMPIYQKPIVFNEKRIALTRAYQREHYNIKSKQIMIEPKIIVLHWTANGSLQQSFNILNPVELSNNRPDLPGNLNVSAHYLVDRDGKIYQLMPDNWMARHVIGLNHYAIGIENVGGVGGKSDLTEKQARANAFLVCHLKEKYPDITYLIGHMDYLKFKNTPLWLEKNKNYQTFKSDPGAQFMTKVRALVKQLHLQ